MRRLLAVSAAQNSSRTERVAPLYAVFAFAIALLAEAGWLLHVGFLAGRWGAYVPMAPSTALAILLLSSGVFALSRWPHRRSVRRFGFAAAGLPLLLGLLVLARFITGMDSGVEFLLSRTDELIGGVPLGRMSPLTAVTVLLEAGALLLLCAPRRHLAAAMAALFALLGAMANSVALLGYCYGAPLMYGGASIPVAFPTAVAAVLVGVAQIRLAVPGMPAALAWSRDSVRGNLLRAFLPGVVLFILFDGWLDSMSTIPSRTNPALWHCLEALVACVVVGIYTVWTARRIGNTLERARQSLEKSQLLLAEAEKTGNVGGWEFDIDSREQLWTDGIRAVHEVDLSYRPTVNSGIQFYTPDSRPVIERAVQRAIDYGEAFDLELELVTAKGNLRSVRAIGRADLKQRKVMGFLQDITVRKQGEAALRESEANFRDLFENAPVAYHEYGREGLIRRVNRAECELLGYEAAALLGRPVWELIAAQGREESRQRTRRKLSGEEPLEVVQRTLVRRDGGLLWVEIHDTRVTGANGEILGIRSALLDITARVAAEQAAREREQTLAAVFAGALDAIVMMDHEARVILWSPAAETMFGYTAAEALGQPVHDLIAPPALRVRFEGRFAAFRAAAEGTSLGQTVELTALRRDGTEFPVELSLSAIQIGQQRAAVGVIRDSSERKLAEEALRESERMLRESQRIAGLGSWILDIPTLRLQTSAVLDELFGIDESYDHTFSSWSCLIHPDDRAVMVDYIRNAVIGQGHPVDKEYRLIRPSDGATRWLHSKAEVELNAEGRPIRLRGTSQDITARKLAEEESIRLQLQLTQSQKMESIGRLAGGVAHDFNNLLTVINGYSQLMLAQLEEGKPFRNEIVQIHKAGQRAGGLTRQLLAFSRKQVLEPRNLDINQLVEEMRPMLERLVGEDIEVRVALHAKDGTIRADPHQLEQVVMNLVVNSRDAIPSAGKLLIETANIQWDEMFARIHVEARAGNYVMLAVTDTGTGMNEETRSRIFEPFFTTKGLGQGTGLGLAMVQGIVAQSGGFVEVDSELGTGTRFKIYLPAMTGVPLESDTQALAPVLGGNETILVVEDQADVRAFTVSVLRQYGYRVVEAQDAAQALLAIGSEHADLLVTDVVMPNVSGRELAARLEVLRPGIRVLFMSGYTNNVIEHLGVLEAGTQFLQKPFSPADLARKVRSVLGARAPQRPNSGG